MERNRLYGLMNDLNRSFEEAAPLLDVLYSNLRERGTSTGIAGDLVEKYLVFRFSLAALTAAVEDTDRALSDYSNIHDELKALRDESKRFE
jgi:hypothetical protein